MKTTLEILAFFGGCLFYAARNAVGKLLLTGLIKSSKFLFRFGTKEAELYTLHKNAALEARRLKLSK